ncbi:MAG: hypothetical protein CME63_11455 [Halobacteriovoraceae bacterium]|nr:hypothetical protein [Halobacteriovoraceae bacterium]|tara:strand:- start:2674 stop:3189 length:516 start_codon:yes stop_codon:yes gene_type:complete
MALIDQLKQEVDELSDKIGEFIRYWGFKKVHGQVWCYLYLSQCPLDAGQLIERLDVSKALMSKTISELLEYGVIIAIDDCRKKRRYTSNPNILHVITGVLRHREKELVGDIYKHFRAVESFTDEEFDSAGISKKQVQSLGKMVQFAESFLNGLLRFESVSFKAFKKLFEKK